MRHSLVLRVLLPALLLSACDLAPKPEVPDATLAIAGVTVIDVAAQAALEGVTVLIDGDRIAAIGRSSDLIPAAGVTILDARGQFLIPGLWDMHVHLANETQPEMPSEQQLALFLALA